MLYYSEFSKGKIVHFNNCPSVKRIKEENRKAFGSVFYAIRNGYKLCKHCNPLEKLYEKDREEVKEFCHQNVIAMNYKGYEIVFTTPWSTWKIIPINKDEYALYHANEKIEKHSKGELEGYHIQNFSFNNLLDLCKYIVRHDKYRYKHPVQTQKNPPPPKKGTKRWTEKQKRKKRNEKRMAAHNVVRLIKSLPK